MNHGITYKIKMQKLLRLKKRVFLLQKKKKERKPGHVLALTCRPFLEELFFLEVSAFGAKWKDGPPGSG